MLYLGFKLVHVAGVVLFLGNITVGVFWKSFADRYGNFAIKAYTVDAIIKADRLFTIPGIVLILIGGIGAALVGNIPFLSTGWLVWGIIVFFSREWRLVHSREFSDNYQRQRTQTTRLSTSGSQRVGTFGEPSLLRYQSWPLSS